MNVPPPPPTVSQDMPPPDAGVGSSAHDRLNQSRERMSFWLADKETPTSETHPINADDSIGPRDSDSNPVAAIAIDVITEWWNQHPLHASASLAGVAARGAIVPLIRRHPVVVLGVAAVAGAMLVRSRAWRWLLRPALVAGVASQIASRLISRVATVQIINSR